MLGLELLPGLSSESILLKFCWDDAPLVQKETITLVAVPPVTPHVELFVVVEEGLAEADEDALGHPLGVFGSPDR